MHDLLIIGAGFGGLGMGHYAKQAGLDFVIVEKAATAGGTWRDNTYPGAACDVESHLYSLSFAPKHDWTRKFAEQPEIRAYLDELVPRLGLERHVRFGCEVVAAELDETARVWRVTLESGEVLSARMIVAALGQLNRPHVPELPGLASFGGPAFHSARWDHNCALDGKRVAVIGTGASAIQFVPPIVPRVKALDLYQRSPPWIVPKPDRVFGRAEQWAFEHLPLWARAYRASIYWKNETRAFPLTTARPLMAILDRQARRFLASAPLDDDKRRKSLPDYAIGCKRILISNDWYPAIGQSHVDLITDHISAVEPGAIITSDGRHHATDVIIFGTGFHTTEFLAPIRIVGRSGRVLADVWRDGAEAYKGISVSGFPNLFLLYGPNTNLAHNSILFMLESQLAYISDAMRLLARKPGALMDVRPEVQAAFNADVQRRLADSVWATGCSSWYLTASGKNTNNWPDYTVRYRWLTRRVTASDYDIS
jgi:cation diffusion facilitator CzcD-associated flavoprotein CzcO